MKKNLFQLFAQSVEKKSEDMKKQRKKQDALIFKMLPRSQFHKTFYTRNLRLWQNELPYLTTLHGAFMVQQIFHIRKLPA